MLMTAMLLAGAQIMPGGSTAAMAPPPNAAPAVDAPAPSAEAIALGERLARTGTLATLLPLQTAKEADEMVAAHPELSAAEQARLRAVATATSENMAARLFAIQGRRYAELLPEADLRVLVASAESPAARRLRAAMPQAIIAVMQGMAGLDFKKDTMAAFCRETGKGCAAR